MLYSPLPQDILTLKIIKTRMHEYTPIFVVTDDDTRNLNDLLKSELISVVKFFDAKTVWLQFDDKGDSVQMKDVMKSFLESEGFEVKLQPNPEAQLKPNEFSLHKHLFDHYGAIIRIGNKAA